jgi:hypothetical protein
MAIVLRMVARPAPADLPVARSGALSTDRAIAVAKTVLRGGASLVFLGHGILALSTKQEWLAFFHVVGLSDDSGRILLPMIGALDVSLAVLVLIKPVRAALGWMTLWAFWTALLRPLSGLSILDFAERGANWACPLALLLLLGWPRTWREWLGP